MTQDEYGRSRRTALKALSLTSLAWTTPLYAQGRDFPNRPIRIVVPYPPGGSADIYTRPLATALNQRLGQSIIIENRPGANGQIGTALVAKAPADGYTILFITDGAMSIAPALSKVPYDARNDFTSLALMAHLPQLLVAAENSGITTLADFINRAKEKPGTVSYGSLGVGSIAHVAMEVFANEAGIELLHIPYQGTAPAMTAAMTGEVQSVFLSIAAALPQLRAGRVRPIALAAATRSPLLPQVPTFAEASGTTVPNMSDFDVRAWFGLFTPKGTPDAVMQLLRREFWAVLSSKEYVSEVVIRNGSEPATVPPEGMEQFIRDDQTKWASWVKRVERRLGKTS
jgi:tripartite-type tricarboxylate transporter receptor subunit TctC